MLRLPQVSLDSYTRAGDVAVIAICVVMLILLTTSYVSRTRSFRIFIAIIGMLVAAALVGIFYHEMLNKGDPDLFAEAYALRLIYHVLLFDVFFLFALYTTVVSGMEKRNARKVAVIASILFVVITGADIAVTVSVSGFRIAEDGTISERTNMFMIGYVLFIIFLSLLMRQIRNLVYKRVMSGFFGTMTVSIVIRFAQVALRQSSLTTMTFVFPAIAMLYIMHSNPYNVKIGTVDIRAMEDMVRNLHNRNQPFIIMSLLLPSFDGEGRTLPETIRAQVRRFSVDYFRNGVLFQISNGQIVMIAKKASNPDYQEWMQAILEAYQEQHRIFKLPYKIVYGESVEAISRSNEYASLIQSIHNVIPDCTMHRICAEDITRFNRSEYILRELADISSQLDLEDPRVLAYCQPVFNLQTGRFDTAEALMRLKLKETGLVLPDQFIPLAESHGYIHALTEIILHKTCREIRRMTKEGLQINRISVNVSVLELKEDSFCGDVSRIIDTNRISGEKIAIELTETQSDADFIIIKEKIEELHRKGIRFYLDDFGTGYSNMERIMELPFDTIKFDRSMVVASGTDERSERIVENLAHMFDDLDYAVLYEGVEDDLDEERCREMSASYLQGYKYSRPLPIERLRDFLQKVG